jgi:hypothetical protein
VLKSFPFPNDLLDKTNDEARAERSRGHGQSSNAMAR